MQNAILSNSSLPTPGPLPADARRRPGTEAAGAGAGAPPVQRTLLPGRSRACLPLPVRPGRGVWARHASLQPERGEDLQPERRQEPPGGEGQLGWDGAVRGRRDAWAPPQLAGV